jgi:hypothetical protein
MKKILWLGLLSLFMSSPLPLGAQWTRLYSHSDQSYSPTIPQSIQQTYDGGYIIAGCFYTFGNLYEALIMKLSQDGTIEWQFRWGDKYQDMAYSATQTLDGGYIVGGMSRAGGRILKLAADGSIEWSRVLGWYPFFEIYSLVQTPDGGYVLGGPRSSIVKLSAAGDIEWQLKFLDVGGGSPIYSIQPTFDGGYIAAGEYKSSDVDIRVVKLGGEGEVQWQHAYLAPRRGGYAGTSRGCIRQTIDGGYVVIGYAAGQQAPRDYDIWILKLFASGEIEWQKTYGGMGSDRGYSIVQTADTGYIAACEISDDQRNYSYGFLKLTAAGDLTWAKTFEGSAPGGIISWGSTIQQTWDGGFITACSYSSELLVLKLRADGTTCNLVERDSMPVTATSVIPIKILSQPMDLDMSISPSSIDYQDASLSSRFLCRSEDIKDGIKKGVIRR